MYTSLTAVAVRAALYYAGWAYEIENVSPNATEKMSIPGRTVTGKRSETT